MENLVPEAVAHIERLKQAPKMYKMDPNSVRNLIAQAYSVEMERAPVAKIEDQEIPTSDGNKINIRIYTPEGNGPFKIITYFHGGGWVIGDIEISDASCRMLANCTRSVVVSVDYRLAPEHKFPIPVNDSYDAFTWVLNNAKNINGDPSKIIVCGDSAGGNLATIVAMKARNDDLPEIFAQVLIYPVTNLNFNTNSYQLFQEGYGLDKELMMWFANHYLREDEDRENSEVSPLLSKNLSNLPPTLIITAANDVLRDEGLAYAERLKNCGNKVQYMCQQGVIHGYFTNMVVFSKYAKESIKNIDLFLKRI